MMDVNDIDVYEVHSIASQCRDVDPARGWPVLDGGYLTGIYQLAATA